MIRIRKRFSRLIVEGMCQDPISQIVGDWVASPFDMVQELAPMANTIVLGVNYALDQVFWLSVNDKRWRRQLVAIVECVGMLWF